MLPSEDDQRSLRRSDRYLNQELKETFREFHQRSGATIIYVSHDQSEAMALATDVAVMSEGRLLQMAPPAEI
ncbi:ABC transporter ATP-binding protein [Rhizobium sp. CCGE 510]|nr:ABC transporter ATP-binding protein [Rhizobium sp. CCGE 510]